MWISWGYHSPSLSCVPWSFPTSLSNIPIPTKNSRRSGYIAPTSPNNLGNNTLTCEFQLGHLRMWIVTIIIRTSQSVPPLSTTKTSYPPIHLDKPRYLAASSTTNTVMTMIISATPNSAELTLATGKSPWTRANWMEKYRTTPRIKVRRPSMIIVAPNGRENLSIDWFEVAAIVKSCTSAI